MRLFVQWYAVKPRVRFETELPTTVELPVREDKIIDCPSVEEQSESETLLQEETKDGE